MKTINVAFTETTTVIALQKDADILRLLSKVIPATAHARMIGHTSEIANAWHVWVAGDAQKQVERFHTLVIEDVISDELMDGCIAGFIVNLVGEDTTYEPMDSIREFDLPTALELLRRVYKYIDLNSEEETYEEGIDFVTNVLLAISREMETKGPTLSLGASWCQKCPSRLMSGCDSFALTAAAFMLANNNLHGAALGVDDAEGRVLSTDLVTAVERFSKRSGPKLNGLIFPNVSLARAFLDYMPKGNVYFGDYMPLQIWVGGINFHGQKDVM